MQIWLLLYLCGNVVVRAYFKCVRQSAGIGKNFHCHFAPSLCSCNSITNLFNIYSRIVFIFWNSEHILFIIIYNINFHSMKISRSSCSNGIRMLKKRTLTSHSSTWVPLNSDSWIYFSTDSCHFLIFVLSKHKLYDNFNIAQYNAHFK